MGGLLKESRLKGGFQKDILMELEEEGAAFY
jgi:hypothetical protein